MPFVHVLNSLNFDATFTVWQKSCRNKYLILRVTFNALKAGKEHGQSVRNYSEQMDTFSRNSDMEKRAS